MFLREQVGTAGYSFWFASVLVELRSAGFVVLGHRIAWGPPLCSGRPGGQTSCGFRLVVGFLPFLSAAGQGVRFWVLGLGGCETSPASWHGGLLLGRILMVVLWAWAGCVSRLLRRSLVAPFPCCPVSHGACVLARCPCRLGFGHSRLGRAGCWIF